MNIRAVVVGEKVAEVPPKTPQHRIKFRRTSTNDIMATTYDPIKWVVPGYISEGFLVLAGRQKLGKTWLAIDMALAVATGGVAIGSIMCEQGDVLYIDMENGPRRIQGPYQHAVSRRAKPARSVSPGMGDRGPADGCRFH